MNVPIPKATTKVKSRKVNKYVNLELMARTFESRAAECRVALTVLSGSMTGGQLAEAKKILEG